jgi:hypothetical protein
MLAQALLIVITILIIWTLFLKPLNQSGSGVAAYTVCEKINYMKTKNPALAQAKCIHTLPK